MRYRLSLTHINDPHSHFEPSKVQFIVDHQGSPVRISCHSGGAARIGYQLQQAREKAKQCQQEFLFLHGGDSFQGTLYFREFKGLANAHLLNELQPDAMVLGNHDIDGGSAPIVNFLNTINFPLLAGNMLTEANASVSSLHGHPRLFDVDPQDNCAKVLLKPLADKQLAIFGITLTDMAKIANIDADTQFLCAHEIARNTIAKLHQAGIYHIIVLSHLGIDGDRRLAQDVEGISLIVGGHSHTLQGNFSDLGLSNLVYGETHNRTPIVHAGKYAETLGMADIEFDDSGKVILLEGGNYFMQDKQLLLDCESPLSQADYANVCAKVHKHPLMLGQQALTKIDEIVKQRYQPALVKLRQDIICQVPRPFVHNRLPGRAFPHGSQLAPLVSQSLYNQTKQDLAVDFALHNAGGVRQSLAAGPVSRADILGSILPFEIPLVRYHIQGQYLQMALESAINAATNNSVYGTGTGSFPYTWGLRFDYDGRLPLGQRITRLEYLSDAGWRQVEPDNAYTGVSSAYTVMGKEGYDPLLRREWQQTVPNITLPSAFIDFLKYADLTSHALPTVNYISHNESILVSAIKG
ncbi:bifunctional metallophosphatase/5'-nucleotidase [Shewanella sp. SNU WT4]|uniref:bifunctional metallophosphatase/5'-nucleotidase n=1 Tax=Shewanella sp. SNU WT4 TaxID=2590015 RepID=UPI001129ABA4|nr:bifunctional metallophosphatase/5'-nucleotidase [Shewanella sp. SNU WT4]QDF66495.1 bifunctional metallophosphatase/5'-nucleotidase [Shewanella sp. SNU WT4]